MLSNIAKSYVKGDLDNFHAGFESGIVMHAIQDFFSHSNYVELWVESGGEIDDEIPTFQEAISNPNYASFVKLLSDKLITGKYPAEGNGKDHEDMQHDVGAGSILSSTRLTSWALPETIKRPKVTPETIAAERVATKATEQALKDLDKKIGTESKNQNK